jgi:hypothetical protein
VTFWNSRNNTRWSGETHRQGFSVLRYTYRTRTSTRRSLCA